jgi:hypothetical protein
MTHDSVIILANVLGFLLVMSTMTFMKNSRTTRAIDGQSFDYVFWLIIMVGAMAVLGRYTRGLVEPYKLLVGFWISTMALVCMATIDYFRRSR